MSCSSFGSRDERVSMPQAARHGSAVTLVVAVGHHGVGSVSGMVLPLGCPPLPLDKGSSLHGDRAPAHQGRAFAAE